MVEIIETAQQRVALCGVCSFSWDYQALVCTCATLPRAHFHIDQIDYPICPRCRKPAQMTRPAS